VEKELKDEGIIPNIRRYHDIVGNVSQQRRLPRAWFTLDPKQASIASDPAPIRFVSKKPVACPLGGGIDILGSTFHAKKGQRL
jgi:hypothetical protein